MVVQISESEADDPKFIDQLKNQYPNQDIKLNIKQYDKSNNPIIDHDVLLQKDGTIYNPKNDFGD